MESEATTDLPLSGPAGRVAPVFRGLLARRSVAVPLGIALFSLLTALGAYVAVPLGVTPVPMTLQTLAVLLAGLILGPYAGAASQLLYLGMGMAGFPFFAMGAAGLPWVLGPTGGYLLSFPLAAAVAGLVGGSEGRVVRTVVGLAVATAVIFLLGACWLAVVTDLDAYGLFAAGVQPFVLGALIKAGIALVVVRQWRARRPKPMA